MLECFRDLAIETFLKLLHRHVIRMALVPVMPLKQAPTVAEGTPAQMETQVPELVVNKAVLYGFRLRVSTAGARASHRHTSIPWGLTSWPFAALRSMRIERLMSFRLSPLRSFPKRNHDVVIMNSTSINLPHLPNYNPWHFMGFRLNPHGLAGRSLRWLWRRFAPPRANISGGII